MTKKIVVRTGEVAGFFDRAKNAVENLQKDISETAASMPPVQTPVSQLFEDETEEETRDLKK